MKFKNHNITEPTGEFAAAIRDFRAVVTHIAGRETTRPMAADWLAPARKRRRTHQHRLILAWSCAAALCFATVPFFLMPGSSQPGPAPIHMAQQTPVPTTLAPSSEMESGLLEQVDQQVSESVPSSLAPLAGFGSTNTASANNSDDALLYGAEVATLGSTNASH